MSFAPPLTLTQVSGLSALHGEGIVHRDLKLENLLITSKGHISIADYGLAHEFKDTADPLDRCFLRTYVGTCAYMAPEVYFCNKAQAAQYGLPNKYNYKADIWALGAIMLEMTLGVISFFAEFDPTNPNAPPRYMLNKKIPCERILDPNLKLLLRSVSTGWYALQVKR